MKTKSEERADKILNHWNDNREHAVKIEQTDYARLRFLIANAFDKAPTERVEVSNESLAEAGFYEMQKSNGDPDAKWEDIEQWQQDEYKAIARGVKKKLEGSKNG